MFFEFHICFTYVSYIMFCDISAADECHHFRSFSTFNIIACGEEAFVNIIQVVPGFFGCPPSAAARQDGICETNTSMVHQRCVDTAACCHLMIVSATSMHGREHRIFQCGFPQSGQPAGACVCSTALTSVSKHR